MASIQLVDLLAAPPADQRCNVRVCSSAVTVAASLAADASVGLQFSLCPVDRSSWKLAVMSFAVAFCA